MSVNLEELIHSLIRVSRWYPESKELLVKTLELEFSFNTSQIGLVFEAISYSRENANDIGQAATSIAGLITEKRFSDLDISGICACIALEQEQA